MRIDRSQRLKFASLQGKHGKKVLEKLGASQDELRTMVLDVEGRLYVRSSAVLRSMRYLGGLWPLLQVFLLVPVPIRDVVYKFVARNRYKWFGKRDSCRVPTATEKTRFID